MLPLDLEVTQWASGSQIICGSLQRRSSFSLSVYGSAERDTIHPHRTMVCRLSVTGFDSVTSLRSACAAGEPRGARVNVFWHRRCVARAGNGPVEGEGGRIDGGGGGGVSEAEAGGKGKARLR